MMKLISALTYYATSLPTVLTQFPLSTLITLPVKRKPQLISLKNGKKFYLRNYMDVWTFKEVIFDNHYQLHRAVRKGDIVIDIGACLGDFAIMVSHLAKTVYSYDIDPEVIAIMQKNLALNQVKNVILNEEGVTSLAKVFKDRQLTHCDFLKIDCEGCEYPVLLGADQATLEAVGFITGEIHLYTDSMKRDYQTLKKHLQDCGFKLIETENRVHDNLKLLYAANTHYRSS
jgi:hypothetical protein